MQRRGATSHSNVRSADGFTLIEVAISVLIVGLIMTVLALATVTVIKTTPVSENGIDDVRSRRALSLFLAEDAMSTPSRLVTDPSNPFGFDVEPARPGLCTTPPGTQNIVQLVWIDASAGTTYVANYRFEPNSDESSVYRITCDGPGPDPDPGTLGNKVVDRLASGLDASLPTSEYDGPPTNELSITLTSASGLEIKVEVASRNPGTP